jgi:hypothetical protein
MLTSIGLASKQPPTLCPLARAGGFIGPDGFTIKGGNALE